MTDLKDTIANIRRARYEGTDKASAFVSGDVTSGNVRNVNQQAGEDESESTARHEDNDET